MDYTEENMNYLIACLKDSGHMDSYGYLDTVGEKVLRWAREGRSITYTKSIYSGPKFSLTPEPELWAF